MLIISGMPVFDSICSAFGTAGTGGFGIRNDSFASYSSHIQWIVAVFMILFGINFNFYYLIIARQPGKALKLSEVNHPHLHGYDNFEHTQGNGRIG